MVIYLIRSTIRFHSYNLTGPLLERISPTNPLNHNSLLSRIQPSQTSPTSPTLIKKQSNGDISSEFMQLSPIPNPTAATPQSQPTSPALLNGQSSDPSSSTSPSSVPRKPSIDISKIPGLPVSLAFPTNPNPNPHPHPHSHPTPSHTQPFHPLPQKPITVTPPVPGPMPLVAQPVYRGIKRERPPSPPNFSDPVDPMRKFKRVFRWPTLECNHSISLRGDGDLTIMGVASSSDGTLLALNCE